MNEITPEYLITQQHELIAKEARAKVQAYIARTVLHESASGFDNGDDCNESKN